MAGLCSTRGSVVSPVQRATGIGSLRDVLSILLAQAPSSAGTARLRVDEFLRPWASDDLRSDVGLLVSELVANAVVHGLPDVRLAVCTKGPTCIRVEVSDGSQSLPELQPRSLDRASGRGLQLVDAVASMWGAQLQSHGKVVWFELVDPGPNSVGDCAAVRSDPTAAGPHEHRSDPRREPRPPTADHDRPDRRERSHIRPPSPTLFRWPRRRRRAMHSPRQAGPAVRPARSSARGLGRTVASPSPDRAHERSSDAPVPVDCNDLDLVLVRGRRARSAS